MDKKALPLLRRRLLMWFDRNRRDLPWRRDRDPYRIWVSEVMLQQTTVATVRSRFEQFLKAFPNLAALAAADEQEVLRHWEGFGYYRRARDLHATARKLVAEQGGRFPDDPVAWAALPGVGRYILGAVLSQAFDRRLPIVEANSLRVLCRLFGQKEDPRSAAVQRWLWQTAEALLPDQRPGDFNQALMELGALVCTPTRPRCHECPLSRGCVAFRENEQESIPRQTSHRSIVAVREAAAVIRRKARVFVVRRPERGRWSNMWEFPHAELKPDETLEAGTQRLIAELTGLRAELGEELVTLRHSVMHFRISLSCLDAVYDGGRFRSPFYVEGRWLLPAQLADLPVSSPQRKLVRLVTSDLRQRRLF